jgi:hypothetical protein
MRDVTITIIVIILEYSLNHSVYMFFYCLWFRWWTRAGRPFRKKYRLCRRALGLEQMQSHLNTSEVLNWRCMKLHTETSETYFMHRQTWVREAKINSLITQFCTPFLCMEWINKQINK